MRAEEKTTQGTEGRVRANREKALFSHIWNFAREKGLTSKPNPCVGVGSFKETGRDVYVDDATYHAVFAAADTPTKQAMELAYLTGQRPADILKLGLPDIRDGSICLRQNKTNKRLRIAIEGQLAQLIEQLIKRTEKSGKVQSLALIKDESGKALRTLALRFRFEKARKKAAEVAQQRGQYDLAACLNCIVPISRFAR